MVPETTLRIGTRESELAVWQATLVQQLLAQHNIASELVFIKSEGDKDLITPLYEMGVQGIFTKTLDIALLNNKIDIAVHSMKDVPTQLPMGIVQAAVLQRGNYKDCFVPGQILSLAEGEQADMQGLMQNAVVATSSARRKAQWLSKYPDHTLENIRGNVNTRLQKLAVSNWSGAIFAAAGLERINKRPANAVDLDWMLPAPSQGAIVIAALAVNHVALHAAKLLHNQEAGFCTSIEKGILKRLMGGCSTPLSALALKHGKTVFVQASVLSVNGKKEAKFSGEFAAADVEKIADEVAALLLQRGGDEIITELRNGEKETA